MQYNNTSFLFCTEDTYMHAYSAIVLEEQNIAVLPKLEYVKISSSNIS